MSPRPAPTAELDPRYSEPGAVPPPWEEVRERLAGAELYWLGTVRPDGRPHVTPLQAVWWDGAPHFATGPEERKARNLASNPHTVLTVGTDVQEGGSDVVVEGEATRVAEEATLRPLAEAYEAKYGPRWRFEVRDGAFAHQHGGVALVFRVTPARVFAFGKGPFHQTRYRFAG